MWKQNASFKYDICMQYSLYTEHDFIVLFIIQATDDELCKTAVWVNYLVTTVYSSTTWL
jgi:hypothetical protein